MATWTIQQQEDGIKAAISSAFFLTAYTGFSLLDDISTRWFGLPIMSSIMQFGLMIAVLYFLRQMYKQPSLLSYGWRIREMFGDYPDEYLRSRFQRATTIACQLMIMSGFAVYVLTMLIEKHGDPKWLSYKIVVLFPMFIGNLSFYLTLRTALDDATEQNEPSNEGSL